VRPGHGGYKKWDSDTETTTKQNPQVRIAVVEL
jgi:hypothetical protein